MSQKRVDLVCCSPSRTGISVGIGFSLFAYLLEEVLIAYGPGTKMKVLSMCTTVIGLIHALAEDLESSCKIDGS
jgi:hypothetical protein